MLTILDVLAISKAVGQHVQQVFHLPCLLELVEDPVEIETIELEYLKSGELLHLQLVDKYLLEASLKGKELGRDLHYLPKIYLFFIKLHPELGHGVESGDHYVFYLRLILPNSM